MRIAFLLCLCATAPLAAQSGSTLRGRVLDAAGQPLAGAMVIRVGGDTTRADSAGRYSVTALPLGRHVFHVAKPGFETIEMEFTLTQEAVIDQDVPLQPASGGARTAADRLDRVGFSGRRRVAQLQRTRMSFLGLEEITAKAAQRVSALFEGLPDVRVRTEGRSGVVYGDNGRCTMKLWIDGSIERGDRGIDEILRVEDIAAIEVYPRPSQVPQEFQAPAEATTSRTAGREYETRSTECGAIVIWRR